MQSIVRCILPDRQNFCVSGVLPNSIRVFFVRRKKKNSFRNFFAGIATVCPLFKFLSFHVAFVGDARTTRAVLFGSVQKIAGTTAKILTASASQQVTEILKIKLIAVFAYVVNSPAHRPISPELVSGI